MSYYPKIVNKAVDNCSQVSCCCTSKIFVSFCNHIFSLTKHFHNFRSIIIERKLSPHNFFVWRTAIQKWQDKQYLEKQENCLENGPRLPSHRSSSSHTTFIVFFFSSSTLANNGLNGLLMDSLLSYLSYHVTLNK